VASDEHERERAAALKHDLGKYVAWRSANLPESAWRGPAAPAIIEALQADILHTRGDDAAWVVFDRLANEWPKPWPKELVAVERAVEVLRAQAEPLARGDANALALADLRAAQLAIRSELAALVRRLAQE
jgi:hypothetical protein